MSTPEGAEFADPAKWSSSPGPSGPGYRPPFLLSRLPGGSAGKRKKRTGLVPFLGDCRIFVARAASGAIFFDLEKAGRGVWEIDGFPADFLESIWKEEEKQQEVIPSGAPDILVPVEVSPGTYYLSIREYQGQRPEVSSKQINPLINITSE